MKRLSPLIILITLLVSIQVHAGGTCKKARIEIRNKTKRKIKVLKLQYYDRNDRKWRNENLRDSVIRPGKGRVFTEDLAHVRGENLYKFKIFYKPKANAYGKASKSVNAHKKRRCYSNRAYYRLTLK